ncbi:MAG: hypothetical protein AAFQ82_24335, partial [Myxococcota bacterium]
MQSVNSSWGLYASSFGFTPNNEANNPQQLFTLSTTPTVYTVNFSALSYDRVLFPFLWAATADENPSPITFYVTDIQWLDETSGAGCTDPNAKNYASTANEDDGSCLYDLTFTVDMACPDAVNGSDEAIGEVSGFTNVAITGPLFGFSGEINMTPAGNGTYTITLSELNLPNRSFEYLYITDNFASKERLFDNAGPDCSLTLNSPTPVIANRVITPVSGQSYSDVFGQCGACPEPFAWSLGEPIATTAPPMQTVTEATGMAHPLSPGPVFDGVGGPYPTNAWWLSAATGDASRPINTLPNQVRVTDSELWLGPTGSFSVSSDRVDSLYQDQLSLGAEETLASRQVVDFDLLSVTIEWEGAIAGTMSAPLVRGSPYSTMFYDGLTPVLRAGSAISTFSGDNGRFEVTLSDGSAFIVYTAPAIPLTQDGDTLSANAPFTGSVRIARQGTSDSVL